MKKCFFKCIMILGAVIFAQFTFMPVTVNACAYSMTADPTTIDFSDTAVGANSASTIVTLTNEGCSISNLSLSITGADSSEFGIESTNCTTSLSGAASCETNVRFTPSTAGAHSASFHASFGSVPSTVDVALTGTGVAAPASDNTALLVAAVKQSQDDSDGCSATAATGAAGKKAYGPAALGLVAMLGLVMATVAVRRRVRKRD